MSDQPTEHKSDSNLELTATNHPADISAPGQPSRRSLPTNIGAYRILALLGEGGMGIVYQAEQRNPHRIVALKVIKLGVAGEQLLRRFEQEAQALGRLQHPGIAQIYEAGTADSGFGPQPYFAMEFIQGHPLLDYAANQQLDVRARLELMARICDAVNHAHQRGIIHRDLKPGNILVDEAGQPKILDFGVARLTDSDAQATRQTDMGQLIGTLAYMSPEQVLADPLALDIRSDVYALGVILYELLAGRLPYEIGGKAIHEVVQAIREEEPAPLSSINRSYRGDVATIVEKALEKDRNRRYSSAADLAADIRHYLADEPIVARPATASYQLQKFARRHKALVAAAAAVFVALTAGVVVSTWQAVRARRAEAEARAVNEFLQNDLLGQASAYQQSRPDPNLTVRTALDRAASRVAGKFPKQPVVEASIRHTIGSAYIDLSLYAEAQQQLETALALRRRELGEVHPDTLSTLASLAAVNERRGKFKEAAALYLKVLEPERRLLGEAHPNTLKTMNGLAVTYVQDGRYAEAEQIYERAIPIEQRVFGEENLQTLRGMGNLATIYEIEHKHALAEKLFVKSLEIKRRVLGESNPESLDTMANLADFYNEAGEYGKAMPLATSAVATYRRVLGPDHQHTIAGTIILAQIRLNSGSYSEAEALFGEALRTSERALGPDHPRVPESMAGLAETYEKEGRLSEADSLFNKAVDGRRRVLGQDHPATLDFMVRWGRVKLESQKYQEAELLFRDALKEYEKTNPDDWERYYCQYTLGASLAAQKRSAEAEPLMTAGFEGLQRRKEDLSAADRSVLGEARQHIVKLYTEWGKPEKAREWQSKQ